MPGSIIQELFNSIIPGFVFSVFIPLLFLIILVKNKSSRYILIYFCWGIVSVLFAFLLNEWFALDPAQSQRVASDIAPIIEETLKALPLLLFFRKGMYNRELIIYCAMASGIGFSVQETLYFFTELTSSSNAFILVPLIVRTVTTCLMHGMTTAIIGFGIAITIKYKNIRIPMILGLLALSATIHSLFNILISTRLAFIALVMPALLYLLGLALLSGDGEDEGDEEYPLKQDSLSQTVS